MTKALVVYLFLALQVGNSLSAVQARDTQPPVIANCIGTTGSIADLVGLRNGVLVVSDSLQPAAFGFDADTCATVWKIEFPSQWVGLLQLTDDLLLVQLFDRSLSANAATKPDSGSLLGIDVASGEQV